MIGRIGPRIVSAAPKAATLEDSLNLLLALGGGDERVRGLIVELKAAVEHNERLVAQFQELTQRESDVSRREREASEAEARVDAKLAKIARIYSEWDKHD